MVTIVFFDARMHPGPRYGVAVKLREWTSPRQTLATQ
jgi:hypothetical protein